MQSKYSKINNANIKIIINKITSNYKYINNSADIMRHGPILLFIKKILFIYKFLIIIKILFIYKFLIIIKILFIYKFLIIIKILFIYKFLIIIIKNL
jgi:hypothetical protein